MKDAIHICKRKCVIFKPLKNRLKYFCICIEPNIKLRSHCVNLETWNKGIHK